jgi:hypothetical protein
MYVLIQCYFYFNFILIFSLMLQLNVFETLFILLFCYYMSLMF